MRARISVPLWVSLPCLAVSAVALGAVAAGAAGLSGTRGFAEHRQKRGKPSPAAADPAMQRITDEITRMETLIAHLDASPPGRPGAADLHAEPGGGDSQLS
jgi:hypothetical protein